MLRRFRLSSWVAGWLAVALLSVQAAKLDIEGRDLNGQDIKALGGMATSGVLVTKAMGNALAAGIQDRDVIVAVDGRPVAGLYGLEEALKAVRAKQMSVAVQRIGGDGLLKSQALTYVIDLGLDLQVQKAFSLELGYDSPVRLGRYREQALLLWHANRVWVYDKEVDREHFVSLLKVYNLSEHKTYRLKVPEKVLLSRFLTEDGLLLYFSATDASSTVGVVDMQSGPRNLSWHFEMPPLKSGGFDVAVRDVNGDGLPEVYVSRDASVFCLDGSTGNMVWKRQELSVYLNHQRKLEDADYSRLVIADFNRDGVDEACIGVLLLNLATGEDKEFLTFDPAREGGGILECRDIAGDPMPDVITAQGLVDGHSGEKAWEPLRSPEYFLADVTGDGKPEIAYLAGDARLHIHDAGTNREMFSVEVEGVSNLVFADFNGDGYGDLLVKRNETAALYQTNIPVPASETGARDLGLAGPLLDYGMRKDKFFMFGRDLFRAGKVAESVPLFLRALVDNPRREDTVRFLASAYAKTGQYESALGLLKGEKGDFAREVLQPFSGEIVAYLLDRKQNVEAIRFLEMRKENDQLLLARCYLAAGRPESAIRTLSDLDPKPAEVQLVLGRAYVLVGKVDSARYALQDYVKAEPASCEAWIELGELEAHDGKWDDATAAFARAASLDPVEGGVAMSRFHLMDGEYKNLPKATEYARGAYQARISDSTRLQMAAVLVEARNYEEAATYLDQILDPGRSVARFEDLKSRCLYQVRARSKVQEAARLVVSPVFRERNFVQAVDLLQEVLDTYAKSDHCDEARMQLGELYLAPEHQDLGKAQVYFKEVAGSNSPLAAHAQAKIAEIEARLRGEVQPLTPEATRGPGPEERQTRPKDEDKADNPGLGGKFKALIHSRRAAKDPEAGVKPGVQAAPQSRPAEGIEESSPQEVEAAPLRPAKKQKASLRKAAKGPAAEAAPESSPAPQPETVPDRPAGEAASPAESGQGAVVPAAPPVQAAFSLSPAGPG